MDKIDNFYKTATELYTSSLRALEQRSTAFLFSQSLLVGALAILFPTLANQKDYNIFIPLLGVTMVGLALSLAYFVGHKVTSIDTAYWRAYMRWLETKMKIEDNFPKNCTPWQLCFTYAEQKENKAPWSRGFAQRRLPAPILWLFSPGLFTLVWIYALLWVVQTYCQSFSTTYFWTITSILTFLVTAKIVYSWLKPKDKIYEEIGEIVKRAETND